MSKNVKIILIVAGILVFLSAACVGGLMLFAYKFVDTKAIDKSINDGKEFGKTTDNLGCQTKAVSMIETLSDTDIGGMLNTQYFFDSCLETSSPSPNFCDGAADPYKDIFNQHKGKDAECEKLGLKGSIPCRQVIEKKLDYCAAKK
jgi:hypothetical protein